MTRSFLWFLLLVFWPLVVFLGDRYLEAQVAFVRPKATVTGKAGVSKASYDIIYLKNTNHHLTLFPNADSSTPSMASVAIDRVTGVWDFKVGLHTDQIFSGNSEPIKDGLWVGNPIPIDKLPPGSLDHGHPGQYSVSNHEHSEYARSSHTHPYSPVSHGHSVVVTAFSTSVTCSGSSGLKAQSSCPEGMFPASCNCRFKMTYDPTGDFHEGGCSIEQGQCTFFVNDCDDYQSGGVQSVCMKGS